MKPVLFIFFVVIVVCDAKLSDSEETLIIREFEKYIRDPKNENELKEIFQIPKEHANDTEVLALPLKKVKIFKGINKLINVITTIMTVYEVSKPVLQNVKQKIVDYFKDPANGIQLIALMARSMKKLGMLNHIERSEAQDKVVNYVHSWNGNSTTKQAAYIVRRAGILH